MGKKSKSQPEESVVEEADNTMNEGDELTYEEKIQYTLPIAQPMASRKLAKKIFKVAKKGRANKQVLMGLKAVKKQVMKGSKGFVVLAGDADPMDAIAHMPILCEENKVPYVWVPSRKDLGHAIHSGGAITLLVQPHEDYQDTFDEAIKKVKEIPLPL